jgi:diguanylate cyclase (GGDEF)-like protein
MVRESGVRKVLNRVRLGPGKPLLPYRLIVYPLFAGNAVVGLIAGMRDQRERPFEASDLSSLGAAIPALLDQLRSRTDTDTGLLRRSAFELEVASRCAHVLAACVVYADLDQIHAVNELSGFDAGDEVIRDIGRLLHSMLQSANGVATHLSGDRYVAVLFGQTLNQASDWGERVRQAVERLELPGRQTRVTLSLGVAAVSGEGDLHGALAAAETACRVAKDRGRNRVEIYESGDGTIVRRHAELGASRVIIDALEGNRYALYAQPIVPLNGPMSPVYYEILLRLQNVAGEFVSVGEYLRAAERYQILERLDRWVVERVLHTLAPDAALLRQSGVGFSVNITGQALSQPSFADFVRTGIKRNGLPRGLLDFEFTETAAVRNLGVTRRFVERIADVGSRIALDDFGTGLSSLGLLKALPVQRIKIDGSFIRDILVNPRSQALVAALVQIARQLGLETVAEFVETTETAQHLCSLGVTHAQGYLYGRARPLTDILADLRKAREPMPRSAVV